MSDSGSSSEGLGVVAAGLFVILIIRWIVDLTALLFQALATLVGGVAVVVGVLILLATALVGWIGLGVGCNLLVRYLLAGWGDRAPDRKGLAYRARIGLVVMFLAPLPALTLAWMVGHLGWWALLLLSAAAYYGAWWLEEIPYRGRKIDVRLSLERKTEVMMRYEEKRVYGEMVEGLRHLHYRLQLFLLELTHGGG